MYISLCLFFFFKQKTAYEMRISDWSSDVCSSDLIVSQWFRRGPIKTQFPDATGAIDGRQRDSFQPGRFGTDKVQSATGIGDDVGIGSFEIEREHSGAVELPADRGNPRAVAHLDRLGNSDTDTRLAARDLWQPRSEEHTSELQSLMRISYAVFCLK